MSETTITISNITFDCTWSVREDAKGNTHPLLEKVTVNGQDITMIISVEWWQRIEQELASELSRLEAYAKLKTELNKLEAYCI